MPIAPISPKAGPTLFTQDSDAVKFVSMLIPSIEIKSIVRMITAI